MFCARVAMLEGHERGVTSLAVLESGRLASGSGDRTIKVWEIVAGACVATLEWHEDSVPSMALTEGGPPASGSWDRTIKIWESGLADVVQ